MRGNSLLEVKRSLVATAVLAALLFLPSVARAQATQRPIQDFLTPNLGGSYIIWYQGGQTVYVFSDYFGRSNAASNLNLGTKVDGSITENPRRDGRADVHVILHASNALTYCWDSAAPGPTLEDQLVFGHSAAQVFAGADAGLGDDLLTVDFINPAPGAPLPNLTNLIYAPIAGQQLKKISVVITADGTLRALFGVPDGTPGMAHTTQRGMFTSPGLPNNGQDTYPAEHVKIWATGN